MNDGLDRLDELLRRRLQAAAAPPPPHVWPAVEDTLRKRKRRLLLWLFAAGALSAAAVIYLSALRPEVLGPQPEYVAPRQEEVAAAPPAGRKSPAARASDNQVRASLQPALAAEPRSARLFPEDVAQAIALAPEISPAALSPEMQAVEISAAPLDRGVSAVSLLPRSATQAPAAAFRLPASPKQIPFTLPRKRKDPGSCYDFSGRPNVWFSDVYAGPSLPSRRLTSPDPEFQSYSRLRHETESPGAAFNAGLRASLLLNRHYLVRAGLHYDQFTEVFEYADPNYIEYTVKVRNELVGGVWQTITDTIGVDYGEHYQKTYNRYGMLDIPIMLGGEWRSGRTGFSLQAGASVNIFFWNRGAMLSPQGVPTDFDRNQPAFRARTGASLMGSVQWFWHLRPQWRVFVEPYYRRVLQPISPEGNPVRQQYSLQGVQLGITKILD
ncbi:MAG: hypothetical protein ACR2K1_02035 [Saprospiraceae bacterium]